MMNKYHRAKVLRAIRERAATDEAVTVAARGPITGTFSFRTINYDELEIIKDLGSGNFGHCRLARYAIIHHCIALITILYIDGVVL